MGRSGQMVKVVDTAGYFLEHYDGTIDFLRNYYEKYPEIFKEYFTYHCKDTEERHQQSLLKYETVIEDIEAARWRLPALIEETAT